VVPPTPRESRAKPGCPVSAGNLSRQKTARGESLGPPVARDEQGVWHVRGYSETRAVLRADSTVQAGFRAEQVARMPGTMRPPVLYGRGEAHRQQRTEIARLFTPVTTAAGYRRFMETFADALVAELVGRGRADLSELAMRMAVQVAAQVVGLTNSRADDMAKRIEASFDQKAPPRRGLAGLLEATRNHWRLATFYLFDVRPAIRARTRTPREDVISHLIAKGYRDLEILTECVTYGAAGMATTREFIAVAAWHLLEHPKLREKFLGAKEKERHALLHELLRLEPVVGHLYRRATGNIAVESGGRTFTIPAGSLIDLHLYGTNGDERAVGEAPLHACTARRPAPGVQPYALSFGDGSHRCPGAFIAIQESDIFLTRLLALPGLRIEKPPTLSLNEVVAGYELRDFIVAVGR
jgi:cytochrome P450